MSKKKGHTRESAASESHWFQITTADQIGAVVSASPGYWALWPDDTVGTFCGEVMAWVVLFDRKTMRLDTVHPVTSAAFLDPPAGIVSPSGMVRRGTRRWPTMDAWALAHGIRIPPGRFGKMIRAAKNGGAMPDGVTILSGGGRRHDNG